jgi:hypothetical protein
MPLIFLLFSVLLGFREGGREGGREGEEKQDRSAMNERKFYVFLSESSAFPHINTNYLTRVV